MAFNNTTTDLMDCDYFDNGTVNNVAVSTYVVVVSYACIFLCGVIGNGLVIYVILRYAKMKTVTNLFILNLAVSDFLYLLHLPLISTTTYLKYWMFGNAVCKINFVLYSINFFAGVFTLTSLGGDRYIAVCHAIKSQEYRTPKYATLIIIGIWSLSFFVMLPTILYSKTVPNHSFPGKLTCTIEWPSGQLIPTEKAYTWYTFLLGFGIPVSLISVFYLLVILRLRTVGPVNKSKETKKAHRKVTRMVLAVISVYIVCWLPYWCFQVNLTLRPKDKILEDWEILMFNIFTVLTSSNSMLNPILYAFLSDNFRRSFLKSFHCTSLTEANRSLYGENSFPTKHRRSRDYAFGKSKDIENIKLKEKEKKTEVENGDYQTQTIGHVNEKCRLLQLNKVAKHTEENNEYKNNLDVEDLDAVIDHSDIAALYADKQIQTREEIA
ncbi:somatostatin receptor type 2-like [Ylistrum balloti]|uniref:somatostatin receptor type 2-like n=1 Tax=Ylistrum balloti TaxID=509963 RepID=UPI002905CC7A|nr:somatostatin receptor type 2-like [Ylistrum balloti]